MVERKHPTIAEGINIMSNSEEAKAASKNFKSTLYSRSWTNCTVATMIDFYANIITWVFNGGFGGLSASIVQKAHDKTHPIRYSKP